MSEDFLHFLWKFQLFETKKFRCTSGEAVEVLHAGSYNSNAGPDFFNARVRIDGQIWAGNVEIHWRSSDWNAHGHQKDRAYDNVILHVVVDDDSTPILRQDGSEIYCAAMVYDKKLEERYAEMLQSTDWVACQNHLNSIDPFVVKQLLGRLLVERLGEKVAAIQHEFSRTDSSWEETFYRLLFKSFGFSINALPFELLAKSLPYQIVLKHRSSLLSVEALLFGQAGMLEELVDDPYFRNLKAEYTFLRTKYKLKPLEASLWKFLRTRPQNFPTIRLAQLASILVAHTNLFSKILECNSYKSFQAIFKDCRASSYWQKHYTFGRPSGSKEKELGDGAINLLAINLWVPVVFAYGHLNDNYDLKDRSLEYLDMVGPDENSTIARWRALGMPTKSAFYTQALLHLKNEYCESKRCLGCSIGKKVVEGNLFE